MLKHRSQTVLPQLKAELDKCEQSAQATKYGIEKGELIGRIKMSQSILGLATGGLTMLDESSFEH